MFQQLFAFSYCHKVLSGKFQYSIMITINEQILKTALLSLSHADIKNIKRTNVHVTCTISYNFCALFGICSFIDDKKKLTTLQANPYKNFI